MYKIQMYNNIAKEGQDQFSHDQYEVAHELPHADAILCRSQNLHDIKIPESVNAIARAGVGVNNIPVDKLTKRGIPVFNAPGANANAVKELVLMSILMACRNAPKALKFVGSLQGSDEKIHKEVESCKKNFVGNEVIGQTLGVIGLGAIGVQVANAALGLGMDVVGFDPGITVQRAWELSADVQEAGSIDEVIGHADVVTIHVPLVEETKNLINAQRLAIMQARTILLNFSRTGIVNEDDVCDALDHEHLRLYVTDFPSKQIIAHPRAIALPHLGASTHEAEENCAIMVCMNLKDFLENGNIRNAVNFPDAVMPRSLDSFRVAIANENIPKMVAQISTILADANYNILDLLNKSRGDIAYTMVDVDKEITDDVVKQLQTVKGILTVRTFT